MMGWGRTAAAAGSGVSIIDSGVFQFITSYEGVGKPTFLTDEVFIGDILNYSRNPPYIEITVVREGGVAGDLDAFYVDRPEISTAIATIDYNIRQPPPAPGPPVLPSLHLEWAYGEIIPHVNDIVALRVITIGIIPRSDQDGKYFYLDLTTSSSGLFGAHPRLKLIFGSTSPGKFKWAYPTYSVGQPDGSINLSVQRVDGALGAVTVAFQTFDGTATAPTWYAAQSGTLSWAAGEGGIKTVNVPVVNQGGVQPDAAFTVVLSNPTGGATIQGPDTTTVTITDAAQPPPPAPGASPVNQLVTEPFPLGYFDQNIMEYLTILGYGEQNLLANIGLAGINGNVIGLEGNDFANFDDGFGQSRPNRLAAYVF
jgi:hypothetical protein